MAHEQRLPPVAQLALRSAATHGVFTPAVAVDCGVSRSALSRAVAAGRFVMLAPGVYRTVGAPVTWLAEVTGATLLAGGQAMAARRTALALHGVEPARRRGRPAILVPYHVSVEPGDLRVTVHRSRRIQPQDRTEALGIACCSVARALVDHGGQLGSRAWREMVAAAVREGLTTRAQVWSQLDGAGPIRRRDAMRRMLLTLSDDASRARSGGELAFADLVAGADLPRPVLNYELQDDTGTLIAELDAAYPQWWLSFELDGYRFHSTPGQGERDKMRDLRLRRRHWDVRRLPMRAVRSNPQWVVDQVRGAIDEASRTLPAREAAAGRSPS